jgi:hypothetical protein
MSLLWGPGKCQLLATSCVALSLALFALGDSDPPSGFCFQTLSFAGPSTIMEPIWDTTSISCAVVANAMCEE